MKPRTTWTLLLLAAGVILVPASALATANMTNGIDTGVVDASGVLTTCSQASGVAGVRAVDDLHTKRTDEASRSQKVSVADDTVLLAIALRNNGAGDIDWNHVRNVERTATRSMTASQTASLDREDVFSALALGIHDSGGSLEALACVSDFQTAATAKTTESQNVSLDQNTVLLAIALHNSGGSSLNFDDVANMDQSQRTEVTHDQDVSVPRENTFLALALGAGGSQGGSTSG